MMKKVTLSCAANNDFVTECTNISFDPAGAIRSLELNANAVLVHLIRSVDEDGQTVYSRITSISCVDADMKDALMEEAHRIINSR